MDSLVSNASQENEVSHSKISKSDRMLSVDDFSDPVGPEHFDANGNILTIPPADIGVPDPVRRPEAVTLGRLDCHP